MPIYVEGSEVAALPDVDAVYVDGEQVWPTSAPEPPDPLGPLGFYTFNDTPADVAAGISRDRSGHERDILSGIDPTKNRQSPGYGGAGYAVTNQTLIASAANASTTNGNPVEPFDGPSRAFTVWVQDTGAPSSASPLVSYQGTGVLFRLDEASSGFRLGVRNVGGTNQYSAYYGADTRDGSGAWHHHALSYDPATGIASAYIDGVLMMEYAPRPGGDLAVGALYIYAPQYDNRGRVIDSLRLYARPLTADEVIADMNKGDKTP